MRKITKFLSIIFLFTCILFTIQSCKKVKTDVDDDTTPTITHPYGVGKGQITIYTSTDLGLGAIDCKIDGQSVGSITHFHPNVTCGSADINAILPSGTHSFFGSASNGTITWSFTFTVTEDKCSLQRLTYTGGGGGGTQTGNAIFYITQNSGGGTITVNCGGQTKYITGYFPSAPGCGNTSATNFSLPAGNYSYTAQSTTQTWSGTVNVPANTCSQNLLNISTTSNIGHLTVWSSNTTVGTITVTCGGQTKYITSKYSSQPNCEANGCAIFDLPYGTYSIVGSATGYSWNPYSMSISTPGQCYMLRLQ
jgi:hypothetical protein